MSAQAFFIGDHAALDFLNSIAAPHGVVIESIGDGEAYMVWLVDAGLLDPAEVPTLRSRFGKPALDQVASEAQNLREWFRQVIGKPVETRWQMVDVAAKLNPILAMDSSHHQLSEADNHWVLQERREFVQARQLLTPIVHVIAELVITSDPLLIKRCSNPPCTLWFYDRTKAHRRRFCSAAVCGNRTKVAAFRERQRRAK